MLLIEIAKLSNGSHRYEEFERRRVIFPKGWAEFPDDMEKENFPFGEVEAEEINGVMTVTKWTAGEIPEPEPTETEQLRADVDYIAAMTGVEL